MRSDTKIIILERKIILELNYVLLFNIFTLLVSIFEENKEEKNSDFNIFRSYYGTIII